MWEARDACRDVVGKCLEKWPRGGSRRKLEDNIKVNLMGLGCEDGRWMVLA
jgi:hypothetical protein